MVEREEGEVRKGLGGQGRREKGKGRELT